MSESVTPTDAEISALDSSSPAHSPRHFEVTETVVFTNCKTGLGIKIVGGNNEDFAENDFGIFVKRVIPGGLASASGRLHEGDQLLKVNNASLHGVSNDRAVQLLRNASASNHVTLVTARGPYTLRRFKLLVENQLARRASSNSQSELSGDSSVHRIAYPGMSSREGSLTSSPTSSVESSTTTSFDHSNIDGHRSDVNLMASSHMPITKDRNHTPSSHPSRASQSFSSAQPSPHSHSPHPAPQLGGGVPSALTGQRSHIPLSTAPRQHRDSPPAVSGVPLNNASQTPGYTPMTYSNDPQHSLSATQSSESTTMGRGVLPERRSPAVGQPAQDPLHQFDRNPFPQDSDKVVHPLMPPLSAIPSHMQEGVYLEPKMTSTPEGGALNGLHGSQSAPLPPGANPSPVLPPYNVTYYSQYSSPTHSPALHPLSRRLSIDGQVRLKIDKLQRALAYLGVHPTAEQNQELQRRLSLDQEGMVPYGEFVAVARQVFKLQLEDREMGSVTYGGYDVTDYAEPPPFQFQTQSPLPPLVPPVPPTESERLILEIERLRRERDGALQEVDKLQQKLVEKEQVFSGVEEELLRIRKQAHGAIHESRALRSRVHLAEVAQQEARNMELDYEEVVVMLEDELNKLRSKVKQISPRSPPETKPSGPDCAELQNRLAVLGCELRKMEASKRTYEVATEKLLRFAEMVHEHLADRPNTTLSNRQKGENARRGTNGFWPPGYLATHKGPVNLTTEARETVKAVKNLIETEPLPHGWEEAYTTDGIKYFLNHVTQCTTWIHPSSGVNHLPTIQERDDLQETRT